MGTPRPPNRSKSRLSAHGRTSVRSFDGRPAARSPTLPPWPTWSFPILPRRPPLLRAGPLDSTTLEPAEKDRGRIAMEYQFIGRHHDLLVPRHPLGIGNPHHYGSADRPVHLADAPIRQSGEPTPIYAPASDGAGICSVSSSRSGAEHRTGDRSLQSPLLVNQDRQGFGGHHPPQFADEIHLQVPTVPPFGLPHRRRGVPVDDDRLRTSG